MSDDGLTPAGLALLRSMYDATSSFRYEADVFYACRSSCAHWSWVLYRVDPLVGSDEEARTPVKTGRFCFTREFAIEQATEAATHDNEENWRGWAAAGAPQNLHASDPETVPIEAP
jgi:hypothetical protein